MAVLAQPIPSNGDIRQGFTERGYASVDVTAVTFQFCFTRAACSDSAAQAG
jgi:hypothetical protein